MPAGTSDQAEKFGTPPETPNQHISPGCVVLIWSSGGAQGRPSSASSDRPETVDYHTMLSFAGGGGGGSTPAHVRSNCPLRPARATRRLRQLAAGLAARPSPAAFQVIKRRPRINTPAWVLCMS